MAYTETLECSVQVDFVFGIDRGWRNEPDEIVDLGAVITGPRGETLECPSWLVDYLLGDRLHLLYDAVSEADADRGEEA